MCPQVGSVHTRLSRPLSTRITISSENVRLPTGCRDPVCRIPLRVCKYCKHCGERGTRKSLLVQAIFTHGLKPLLRLAVSRCCLGEKRSIALSCELSSPLRVTGHHCPDPALFRTCLAPEPVPLGVTRPNDSQARRSHNRAFVIPRRCLR